MKCFTVDNLDAIEGIRLVRAMRPYLDIGKEGVVLLGDDMLMRMRDCLENPEAWSADDLRFDKRFWDVFVHRASVAIDGAYRTWLVPETEESKQRALVLVQADLNYTGVDMRGRYSYLGTHPSLAVKSKVRRLLCRSERRTEGEAYVESVRRAVVCAVMDPGDVIQVAVEWYEIDSRRMWRRRTELPARPISEISFDGSALTVEGRNWLTSDEYNVVETL